MPGQPAATAPMPAGTHAAQPVQLPPSSLPLATWAGAQQATELLHMAAAPMEQLAGEALALPPEAELVVIRFALKVGAGLPRAACCGAVLHAECWLASLFGCPLATAALQMRPGCNCLMRARHAWRLVGAIAA